MNWMDDLPKRIIAAWSHTGIPQRILSDAAGLSGSHLGQIVRGVAKDRLAAKTVLALVEYFEREHGMSATWLLTGRGEMFPSASGATSRSAIVALARAKGAPEDVLTVLEAEAVNGVDPGAAHWTARLRELLEQGRELDAMLANGAAPVPPIAPAPRRAPVGKRSRSRRRTA